MKKTNAALNAGIAVLFIGVMIYLGVYLIRGFNTGYVTAEAVLMDIEVTAQASGIIVREETLLENDRPYVDVVARDGDRVAVGETVANAMDSQTSVDTAARIHELEMQISRAEAAASNSQQTAGGDTAIQAALLELSAAVARGETARIFEPEVTLSSQLMRMNSAVFDSSQLEQLRSEWTRLRSQSGKSVSTIQSPVSGIFTTAVDGYEYLTPEMLAELTPDSLRELAGQRNDPGENLGKVVTGSKWYFAALVNEEDALRLTEGGTAMLELGKYASGTVTAIVQRISHPQNGQCAVVFKCRTALTDTLALRELTAEIVYEQISGLRVPTKAVHVDDEGHTFVYVISAMQVEKKGVQVLYSAGEYYIVAIETDADALRAGNEIIVSGRNLEDGKLLN